MKNIFQKLISRLTYNDELCGKWATEDGSGFSIIMGSYIEFKPDGSGLYKSWSNSDDDTGYEFNGEIQWKRIGKFKIEILEPAKATKEIVAYKLEKNKHRIELSNLNPTKTGNVTIEQFWNFAQVMFKTK